MIRYVKKARRLQGSTGTSLLQLLEMHLDNVVFRSGFAPTIPGARQAVNHGHITVNGRLVNIASYQCRPGDLVGVRQREASRQLIEANMQFPGLSNVPAHLDVDKAKLETKVNSVCEREWVALQIN